jgi:hypothetical protein
MAIHKKRSAGYIRSRRACQAVGNTGGTGNSSSSGVLGGGVGSRGGAGSGTGLAGMEGLKSGSGDVCNSLSMSNLFSFRSNILIIFSVPKFVIEHTHLMVNEPIGPCQSRMNEAVSQSHAGFITNTGGQDEIGKYMAWKP